MSSQTSWSSQGPNNSPKWDRGNFSRQATLVGTDGTWGGGWSRIDPLWLFTCINEGKWTTKMTHLDVNASRINSDKDFALALNGLYNQVNRKWYKYLKLRGLVNISFVQVCYLEALTIPLF